MFYYIEGIASFIDKNLIVIDCSGVGYACSSSLNSISQIKIGQKYKLFTYMHVREDALDLFGFTSMEELDCFKQLISISGVGPKAATAILSVLTPQQLSSAIALEDIKPIVNAPGVGKKLAQRIVLELKGKLSLNIVPDSTLPAADTQNNPTLDSQQYANRSIAIDALQNLGYSYDEACASVKNVDDKTLSVQDIITAALKNIASGLLRNDL